MKKVLAILMILVLSSCAPTSTTSSTPNIKLNNKDMFQIVFHENKHENLDKNLFGTWLAPNNTGSWNFYDDGSHLVAGYMENVGMWLTAGEWSVKDNTFELVQDSYNKTEDKLEKKTTVYEYSIDNNTLEIKSADGDIYLVLQRYTLSGEHQ